jgi:hypothetical protein
MAEVRGELSYGGQVGRVGLSRSPSRAISSDADRPPLARQVSVEIYFQINRYGRPRGRNS